MAEVIVRRNAFTQEAQKLGATYPQVFEKFFKLFESEEIDEATLQKRFRALCKRLRADFVAGYERLKKPASAGAVGRLSAEEAELRNEFRRNVYVLVRDLDGLKWWPHIQSLIRRQTAGKRPSSVVAKPIADLIHFILRQKDDDQKEMLSSAAIVDMANQLAYAKRHDVPFQFLIGFLLEVKMDRAAEKERSGAWEDWHPRSRPSRSTQPSKDNVPDRASKRPSAETGEKKSEGQKSKTKKTSKA